MTEAYGILSWQIYQFIYSFIRLYSNSRWVTTAILSHCEGMKVYKNKWAIKPLFKKKHSTMGKTNKQGKQIIEISEMEKVWIKSYRRTVDEINRYGFKEDFRGENIWAEKLRMSF